MRGGGAFWWGTLEELVGGDLHEGLVEGLAIDVKAWEIGVRLVLLTSENVDLSWLDCGGLQGKGRVWDCFAAENFVSQRSESTV